MLDFTQKLQGKMKVVQDKYEKELFKLQGHLNARALEIVYLRFKKSELTEKTLLLKSQFNDLKQNFIKIKVVVQTNYTQEAIKVFAAGVIMKVNSDMTTRLEFLKAVIRLEAADY